MSPSSSTWTRKVFRRAFYQLRGRKKVAAVFNRHAKTMKKERLGG
jgi:hypothetical protein